MGSGAGLSTVLDWARRTAERWLSRTPNLIRLSVLVFVPLLIGTITWLSNAAEIVTFLLFPPLAAGAYGLFADPGDASPRRFVVGITAGAVCGLVAVETFASAAATAGETVSPTAAGVSVLLTAVVTWAVGTDEPAAFSTARLVLVTGADTLAYVLGVAASAMVVAGAFSLYREYVYDNRARYLYRSVRADDAVLVPLWDDNLALAHFGARLAAAHPAGKVVLLGTAVNADGGAGASVDPAPPEPTTTAALADRSDPTTTTEPPAPGSGVADTVDQLSALAAGLESEYDVDTELAVVQPGDRVSGALDVAADTGCDLVVAPFDRGDPEPVERLFGGEVDVVGLDADPDGTAWRRTLVGVRGTGPIAHASLDFATRLSGDVSVFHAVADRDERRDAERMLADLVDGFEAAIETRVTAKPLPDFLSDATEEYDLLILGASTDRSGVSRVLTPPTYRDIEADCDVAVVHLSGTS
jgi:hypothetical protein